MDFGVVTFGATSGAEWREKVLRYEVAGFDFLVLPDHVGVFDPFSAAAAAAAATAHLRVGTLVLNVEFWNPLLLARAAVTSQLVADGRFVLGLGAGHARIEFEQAGLDYPPPAVRVRRLEALARVVPRLVAGETIDDEELSLHGASLGLAPATVPLLVGGNGDGVLRVAARHADIVSLVSFTSGTELIATNLRTGRGTGCGTGSSLSTGPAETPCPRYTFSCSSWPSRRTPVMQSLDGWARRPLAATSTPLSYWSGRRIRSGGNSRSSQRWAFNA